MRVNNSADTFDYSPAESRKSMRWRHYEILCLIHHLGPFLRQIQADASLASLIIFFIEAKTKLPLDNRYILFWAISSLLVHLKHYVGIYLHVFRVKESKNYKIKVV